MRSVKVALYVGALCATISIRDSASADELLLDSLYVDPIELLCSDSGYDAECMELLDSYQNSYVEFVSYQNAPLEADLLSDPECLGDADAVANLERIVKILIGVRKGTGVRTKESLQGITNGIESMLVLSLEGTTEADAAIKALAQPNEDDKDKDANKKIVLESLQDLLTQAKKDLEAAKTDEEKKKLSERITKLEALIKEIEGPKK